MFGFKKGQKDKEVGASCEISLTNIFVLNHNKAKSQAFKVLTSGNPKVTNSALSEDESTLTSAGHHLVSIVVDKPSDENEAKKVQDTVKKALKAYASQWGGYDAYKALTDDKIYSLDDEVGADENNEGKEGTGKLNEAALVLEADKKLISQVVKSKIDSGEWQLDDIRKNLKAKYYNIIKDELVKAGDKPDNAQKQSVASIQKVIDSQEFEDSLEKKDSDPKNSSLSKFGFYFVYEFKVNGLKETSIGDALKKVGTKLLDGVGIKFTSLFGGGGEEITGKDIRKGLQNAFGGIDPDQLVSRFHANMRKKIPTDGHCDVSVYDKNTILRNTKRFLDAQAKKKVMDADYTLAIKVGEQDGRKGITPQVIADVLNTSIVGIFKKFKNKVTKDDVIVVNNSKNRGVKTAKNQANADSEAVVTETMRDLVFEAYNQLVLYDSSLVSNKSSPSDVSFDICQILFEASSSSSMLSVDFKYPVEPTQPEGIKKNFMTTDGGDQPIVIEVAPGGTIGDKDKNIPVAQAEQKFISSGFEFIGWLPKLKGDPKITKNTTFVAQYRKKKDAKDIDTNAGVTYDYYLVPMPGLKYKSEDDE